MESHNNTNELYHYGVLGMKWGKRKARPTYNSISGYIRKKQISNANNDLVKIKEKRKQFNGELRELNEYDRNPSKIGKSKVSTAIRRSQINSLNKAQSKLNDKERNTKEALKELHDIDQYQKRKQDKRDQVKTEKYEKMVKDNDKRVKMYGKNTVKAGNVIGIASVAYGMHVGNKIIKGIGMSSMKSIANNPKMGNAALQTASILTVAGMGALTISSLKKMNTLSKDMKLTKEYDERQYMYKQAKKKK